MAKIIKLHPPLARWSGQGGGRVRLVLPAYVVPHLVTVLEDAACAANVPLNSAGNVGRRMGQVLAAEQLVRPALWNHYGRVDAELRLTLTHSVALALLAWLLSSPRTTDASSPLRPLLAALHQLLS